MGIDARSHVFLSATSETLSATLASPGSNSVIRTLTRSSGSLRAHQFQKQGVFIAHEDPRKIRFDDDRHNPKQDPQLAYNKYLAAER